MQLVTDAKEHGLDEKGKLFLVRMSALVQEKSHRLVLVSKKDVEFNGKACFIVFIADRTSELDLETERIEFSKQIEANVKFLAQVKDQCEHTQNMCQEMQQNCRIDQLSTFEHMFLESNRALFKVFDRLDYQRIVERNVQKSLENFCPRKMVNHLKRILLHTTNSKQVPWNVKFD